jgi:predicted dehydrogenase
LNNRIVIVGTGSIGRRHARLLAERGDLSVEWCENSPASREQALAEVGPPARLHDSFEAMLETKPGMVLIATPHAFHARQTIAALGAGAHVLCEKPMCDSVADGIQMVAAAKASGRVLTIGFHLHFNEGLRRIRHLVQSGALGEIVSAHCRVGTYVTLVNSKSRYQAETEGALLMDYAHQPDVLHWLLGVSPVAVEARGIEAGALEFRSRPNVAWLAYLYAKPLLVTIDFNYVQMPERHDYEIVGDRGWVHFDFNTGRLRHGRRSTQDIVEEQTAKDRDPMYRDEHQAFLDAIAGKREPESPGAMALRTVCVVDASLRALREGKRAEVA